MRTVLYLYSYICHTKKQMDTQQEFQKHFLSEETIKQTIVVLCQHNKVTNDPITNVITIMLTCPVQLQLVANGIQMFKGKDILFPYQYMNDTQKAWLLSAMNNTYIQWHYYEFCIILKTGTLVPLDHMLILTSLCLLIQSSKKYPNKQSKLAITNIILQRVHSSVSISKPIQAALNACLFKENHVQESISSIPVEQA